MALKFLSGLAVSIFCCWEVHSLLGFVFALFSSYVHYQTAVIFLDMVITGNTLLEKVLNSCIASMYGIIAIAVSLFSLDKVMNQILMSCFCKCNIPSLWSPHSQGGDIMLSVRVCATHMGGFLGPKFSKQGSLFRQIFLNHV